MSGITLRRATVLVATDSAADAVQLRQVLAKEFDKIEVSTLADRAVADFERVLPDVLILAFDTIEKSQGYCLGLLRFSKVAQAHPHRSIVLCSNGDLEAVFALCKKDYYDDYVLYWPQPHDGHRLVMAVWSALRLLAVSREAEPGPEAIALHARSAQAMGAAVDRRIEQGMDHVAAAHASFAQVEKEAAALPVHASLKRALAASRDSLAPMADWAKGLRSDVAPHVAGAQALAAKAQARPVVLIVEDDAFAAKLIAKALEQQSFDIEFAAEAKGLFAVLRRVKPAAILMDVNLPGTDGLTLTEWLKNSPTFNSIPVLMLTGEATRETIARSKAVGAADFIVKPFTRDNLLAKLSRVVG